VTDIDEQWQADLADMNDIKASNDGYRYLLVAMDCFSKYAWVKPTITKDAKATAIAFEAILRDANPRQPQRLQTDKGKEFCNSTFKELMDRRGILHFTTHNEETKAAMVERLNRTLKSRLYRYFTHTKSERYVDILPTIVAAYNSAYHRTIGMAPKEVCPANAPDIYHRAYGADIARGAQDTQANSKPLAVHAVVRLTKPVKAFSKGYEPLWTTELFKVASTNPMPVAPPSGPPFLYKAQDMSGEALQGTYYPQEIQQVDSTQANKEHVIEKIIKRRGRGQTAEVLVKWKGLHRKYNEWIPANTITNV
jgi:hypothetical protein